ncbi:uncharacterized protein LOC126898493 isoform X2 [Daktulosphaira vitifoliae]|uniref:uncharacterized protein LOC126898493 isoform X2 n=1 Tax=Daktulosphaira vitifoliae TaxID=58002 RepID=UPI0021AA6E73|nr:uncharacterized protein LOC126898493 isoform X2 [Daktulosphaira vitifoliae]
MFSLTLIKFSFLLFYVILYTKSEYASKYHTEQLDKLLMYSGWKKLNVVNFVKYKNKTYFLEKLIITPTYRSYCMAKIRALTVHLGCTYAKVINNLFSIIINYQQICINNKERKILKNNVYIHTKILIKIITILIVPTAKLMKGAIDAFDSIHYLPWAHFNENSYCPFIMSSFLGRIEDIFDKLNERTLSCDNLSTYSSAFITIYKYSEIILHDLKNETSSYCNFVPYDRNYLWYEWIQKYNTNSIHYEILDFLKFLTRKLKDYIKSVIIENYFQLGFKFDPITNETFLPSSKELIIQELELKATDEKTLTSIQIVTH